MSAPAVQASARHAPERASIRRKYVQDFAEISIALTLGKLFTFNSRCDGAVQTFPRIHAGYERYSEATNDEGWRQMLPVGIRVYMDDERPTPDGWVRVYWPEQAIALLKTGVVEELSLDHDLGDDQRGTGYDVVLWVEEAVAVRCFKPPKIFVHSANAPAREKMLAGIRSIENLSTQ